MQVITVSDTSGTIPNQSRLIGHLSSHFESQGVTAEIRVPTTSSPHQTASFFDVIIPTGSQGDETEVKRLLRRFFENEYGMFFDAQSNEIRP